MARAAETVDRRRFTVNEYHLMAEAGIFQPDERIELIRGVVRRMSPRNYVHVVAVTRLYQSLVSALAGRASLFQEAPLKLARLESEPEPDIVAIASPHIEDYGSESAKPLLVVEVSESSLHYDLNVKAPLYAEAGIPEYWVLNLVDRELVVFRSPSQGRYQNTCSYRPGERVHPEPWPDIVIDVSDLFPRKKAPDSGS